MPTDNVITAFPQAINATPSPTLDEVVQAMNNWRANKKSAQEPIPEKIWHSIFLLREKFPETTLRGALGVSTLQFRQKVEQRSPSTPTKPPSQPERMDFCEAKTQSPLYKPAKIPATNTLIVEFCRADGRQMKIHTTTDSFRDLMKAFFAGE